MASYSSLRSASDSDGDVSAAGPEPHSHDSHPPPAAASPLTPELPRARPFTPFADAAACALYLGIKSCAAACEHGRA